MTPDVVWPALIGCILVGIAFGIAAALLSLTRR